MVLVEFQMTKPIDPQAAIETMWKTAPLLAKAKGERVMLEEYRKSLKAILMGRSMEKSAAAQEREAYAHLEYIEHLKALATAVEEEEKLRWQMTATSLAVEVWRTSEASNRMIDRATR